MRKPLLFSSFLRKQPKYVEILRVKTLHRNAARKKKKKDQLNKKGDCYAGYLIPCAPQDDAPLVIVFENCMRYL